METNIKLSILYKATALRHWEIDNMCCDSREKETHEVPVTLVFFAWEHFDGHRKVETRDLWSPYMEETEIRIWGWRNWDLRDRVPKKRELCRKETLETFIGIFLCLWPIFNIHLRARPHEAQQSSATRGLQAEQSLDITSTGQCRFLCSQSGAL